MNNQKEFYIFLIYVTDKDNQNNEIKLKDKKNLIENIYSDRKEKNKKSYEYSLVLKYTMKEIKKKL